MADQRLPRSQRIKKPSSFTAAIRRGRFFRGSLFNIWFIRQEEAGMEPESGRRSGPAVGIMVSRKVHLRAVKRNLWKRRIREAFRRRQKDLQPEWALVIQARKQTGVPAYREIEEELLTLCRKAKVLNSREAL